MRITNADKVTLALLLEEGRARSEDLQFHVTLTRRQTRDALNQLVEQGAVIYENASSRYALVAVTGLGMSD
jgi:predicted transcriptional regulator